MAQRGGAATKRHLKRKDAKTQRSQRTEAEGDDSADFEDFAAFVPKDGVSKQIEGGRSGSGREFRIWRVPIPTIS